MPDAGSYRIRPAGRHILTIGRDLIQDPYAAVVELVKNAYDADSPDVEISFTQTDKDDYRIVVSDHGHGMSRDVVINKWMVPSTSDKEDRDSRSPGGRTMQGRKGIGRYAASILGTNLLLETVTASGEKTTLYVEWKDFAKAEYLGDVDVLIQTETVDETAGTTLTIEADEEHRSAWQDKQFKKLQFELKKLMPPVQTMESDSFRIMLRISGVPGIPDLDTQVEPYPLFEYYDYQIAGTIHANGTGELVYTHRKASNVAPEQVPVDFGKPTGCGELSIDIRVYDRDPEALDRLIKRGLKDDSGRYLGRLQTRQLLNEYNGIGVYRNGFRLRPLGDHDFDWLELNRQRIQQPALRIGSNQVIGYVHIQSEEHSQLIEKSARDGLIENDAFASLKAVTQFVIGKLEQKRYSYRQKTGLSRKTLRVEQELERLYSFDELKRDVRKTLEQARVSRQTTSRVIALIETDEKRKSETVGRLRDTVAIYQGQATLGKIINVVLHEGRRPLSYFRNQFPLLQSRAEEFAKTQDPGLVSRIVNSAQGIVDSARDFVALFGRLDPLAAQRRSRRKEERVASIIERASETFSTQMAKAGVDCEISGDMELKLLCWRQDIQAIFTNLIDNSLYWLGVTECKGPRIEIIVGSNRGQLSHVDYKDTGPGIEPDHIDSGVIFDPQFSTKSQGTGLGLAIAGEAAARNGLELRALEHDNGAWFRLKPVEEKEK